MGLCFSKKKPPAKPGKIAVVVSDDKQAKKPSPQQQPKRAAAAGTANKAAAVLVVRPGSSSAKDAAPGEDPKKKRSSSGSQEPAAPKQLPVVLVPSAPVRTSSCTKEEVDAILIQCGRLSRSSSGTGRAGSSGETGGGGGGGGHRRRRSGSKRSYDFDQEPCRAGAGGADEECDWAERQQGVSRPSPHRGSPQRKRSGSRERSGTTGSGSRRASRSPGRRAEIGAAASVATAGSGGGDRARQQQPAKMVSVPAREKGRAPSPAKRCASPRSRSPARMAAAGNENAGGGGPVLSRSSSRRNEQSPYRRNPMAELDENSLRNNSSHSARPQKKSTETAVAATPKKATGRGKEPTAAPSSCKPEIAEDATVAVAASETRAHSSKTTNTTRTASIVAESLTTQSRPGAQPGCRSRRASRDFDQNPGSYTTQLLEDIHNYHQQSTSAGAAPSATQATPSYSLPACVAKACSIVEAVANLKSSSSENRTYEYEPGHSADDKGSVNAPAGSEDFVEPSAAAARKHHHPLPPVRDVVRAETEPQESAGSNSVSGQPWTPSWEPTSVESSDRTWSTGDEVVEQSGSGSHGGRCSPMNRPRQSKQRQSQHEPSGRSRAAGSGNGNGQYRGCSAHRGSGSGTVASGRSGVRVVSANS